MNEDDAFLDDPSLRDPDATSAADTGSYGWDEEFQRHIAALLIADRQFLLQSMDLVQPTYFTNKAHSKICSIVYEFFKKYRILPRKDFIVQELKTDFKDNKALPYYLGEVNHLFDYFQPGLEAREYLQDKIVFFAKIQSVKKAFYESLKLIDKAPESDDTWNMVYDTMRKAMQTDKNFELGHDYFKDLKDRYKDSALDLNEDDRFYTGIPSIDSEISSGAYGRGEIISVVAGSGVGKSVMLACMATTNVLRGKRVLYITLELAEKKVAARLDAIFTGLSIHNLQAVQDDVFETVEKLQGVAPKVGGTGEGDGIWPLIIKQYPAGSCTVNTIRAYISQLRFQGYDPDMVIVDYVGEMADYPGIKTYESREKLVRELRGMALEENVFVATAMQPNRDAKNDSKGKSDGSIIDDNNLADAYGQVRPLDGCFSLNQNDIEKKLCIGRGYMIKQRDGKSRYTFYLEFNAESLRITELGKDEYRRRMNSVKETVSDETMIDEVRDSTKDDMKKRLKNNDDEENTQDNDGTSSS